MNTKVSVVINTLNSEKDIERALKSVSWAQEIIVCDMRSDDKTVEIAKRMGAKVVIHNRLNYVEPARNFSISKASNNWILILDPDEEVPRSLSQKLIQITKQTKQIDFVRLARKNIIFNRWMKAALWWPDYNIRFFKKGRVVWTDEIHRPPKVNGEGLDLPAEEDLALIHHNYSNVGQFIERMNRYTTIEAKELIGKNYKFVWTDLIQKPLDEFLSRFFAGGGYKDGLHGLALSLLQAFSFLIVYLKVWELTSFKSIEVTITDLGKEQSQAAYKINWWFKELKRSGNSFKSFLSKLKF